MKWIFFLLFWNLSFAESRLDSATIEQYLKIQKEFYDQVCIPGTEVQYQKLLKEYIGDGGMGIVFKVEKDGKEYALKICNTTDDEYVSRFKREIRGNLYSLFRFFFKPTSRSITSDLYD